MGTAILFLSAACAKVMPAATPRTIVALRTSSKSVFVPFHIICASCSYALAHWPVIV
jgi:hypothetical protein